MPLLLILAVACFASAASIRVIDPLVPGIAREFSTSLEQAALLASAYTLPYALGQPVLGALGDALGKVRIVQACLALMIVGLAGCVLATSYEALFVFRAISGIAGGGIIPVTFAILGDRIPMDGRQVALSRLVMSSQFAIFLAAAAGGWIADSIGWRSAFGLVLAVTLAAFVMTAIWLQPQPNAHRPALSIANMRKGYAEVLANPISIICYGGVFIEGLAIYGMMPFIAGRLEGLGLGGLTEAGLVIGAMSIGGIAFTFSVGRLLAWFGRTAIIRVAGAVCALALALFVMSNSWQQQAACFALLGFGFFMVHNSLQAIATELAPRVRGSAVALFAFSLFLGQALGPIVYAPAFTTLGPHAPLLIAAALMAVMTVVVAHFLARETRT